MAQEEVPPVDPNLPKVGADPQGTYGTNPGFYTASYQQSTLTTWDTDMWANLDIWANNTNMTAATSGSISFNYPMLPSTLRYYNISASYENIYRNGSSRSGCSDCPVGGQCERCIESDRRYAASHEEREARKEKVRRQRIKATRRGRKMLLGLMTDEQQREYAKTKKITIPLEDGRVFRLRKGATAERVDQHGQVEASYCIHLPHGFIPEDTLVAQMLMLQNAPEEFERIANITAHRSRPETLTADDQAHLRAHDQESRAMLRAEGIEDPDTWIEGLRTQVRTAYVQGSNYNPNPDVVGACAEMARVIIEDEIFEADRRAEEVVGHILDGLESIAA